MYFRFIVSACCCLMSFLPANAQNPANLKKGDACMKREAYAKAAAFYKKAADNNMNDVTAKEKSGKAFMAMGDFQSAEAIYKLLATSPMAGPINKFYYAQVLRINGKYEPADKAYRSYFEERPNDPLAGEFKNFGEKVEPLLKDAHRYKLTNIPENSVGADEGPSFCLYNFCFSSNGHASNPRKGTFDLYLLRGGNASNPANPQKIRGHINRRLNEGPATFSKNGMEMIFTSSNYHHKSAEGCMKLGLYHADYDTLEKKWRNINPLNITDYNYNFMQPSLSKDGNRLFFASDMKGGSGETDIYVSMKQGCNWGAPVNLGSGINTMGREETPFIADNGTLYFASDSRLGLGGLDIYAAILTDTVWGHAVNAGAPLNSAFNDFGYVSDSAGLSGYIVSDRRGGAGGKDIYHFTISPSAACGVVVDAKTQKFVDSAAVTWVGEDGKQRETKTSVGGDFCFELAPGKVAQLKVNKTGYEIFRGEISTGGGAKQIIMLRPKGTVELRINVSQKGSAKLQGASASLLNTASGETVEQKSDTDGYVKFDMEPNAEYVLKISKTDMGRGGFEKFVRPVSTIGLKAGQILKEDAQLIYHEQNPAVTAPAGADRLAAANAATDDLPMVYFGVGSFELSPAAKTSLDKIVNVMNASPGTEVEISSNTDASGSMHANMILSARRALVCLNYLCEKGLSKKRFIAVGYGDKRLVNNCVKSWHCTEAEQAMNRRTEFKIIKQ